MQNDNRNSISLRRYLWPQDHSTRLRVVVSMSCLILGKVCSMYVPMAYKHAVDGLSAHAGFTLLAGVILAYGGARIMSQIFNEFRDMIFARVGHQAVRALGLQVFEHLHRLSLRFHIMRKTGGLSRIIERGTKGIESLLRFSLYNIIPTLIEIFLVCGILWYSYGILFAIITFVTLAAYVAYTLWISEWRIAFVRKMNDMDNHANTKAIDSLINFETVKYFCNEDFESKSFNKSLTNYQEAAIKNSVGLSLINIGQIFIITLGLVIVMIISASRIESGAMTIGDFVLINSYILQLSIPLYIVGFAYREIKSAIVSMEDMLKLFDIEEEIKDKDNAPSLKLNGGAIKFDNVSFYYDKERQILKNINFIAEAGQTVAIVGTTGSGKSTIARLLFRFYDVVSGKITIDGQDVRDVAQHSLRSAIGVVPQDTVLFNDTIYYNISYGNVDASRDDVVNAAKLAHIHDFITSLPEGYDTTVGERGLKLSGGEKQRIAIARTVLKNPQIYIFDEATSALDTGTEKEIQANLNELASKHTAVIIAHRLSTIVHADQILVLENGEVVERGTHAELLKLSGKYATLWHKQQEELESTDSLVFASGLC